jgi:hypothetical protein
MNQQTITNQPQRAQAPLMKQLTFAIWVASILSLSVITVFRRRVGFDTLNPSRIVPLAIILLFWADVVSFFFNQVIGGFIAMVGMGFVHLPYVYIPNSPSLKLFACAMLICAFVKRRLAWKRFLQGSGEHTHSIGTSYLRPLLPMIRPDHVNRFVDPAICVVVGFFLYQSEYVVMGVWLMLSGAALALAEQQFFEWTLEASFLRHNAEVRMQMEAELLNNIQISRQRSEARPSRLTQLVSMGSSRARAYIDRPAPDIKPRRRRGAVPPSDITVSAPGPEPAPAQDA